MNDFVLEAIRVGIVAGVLVYLWRAGQSRRDLSQRGWHLILAGFGLLLLGCLLDVSDNFPSLNRFVVIGDTETEAFLEKLVGFLGGFILLAIGLIQWIPTVTSQAALKDSEERFRQLVETTSDFIWEVDRTLVFTYASPRIKELLGYAPDEVVGKTPFELMSEDEAPRLRRRAEEAFRAGAPVQMWEIPHLHKDGSGVVLEINAEPVRDEGGDVVGYRGIGRDVTHRRNTEVALRQERYLLHSLMDHLPHNIYFKDADGRFIRINKALADCFGLSDASRALGKTDFDFFTEEHARQAQADEQGILSNGRPMIDREEKETWLDRPTTWAVTTKMPLYDEAGSIVGTFGVSRDITAQKQAAEALKTSEVKYRTLYDASRDAIMLVTPDEGFFSGNPAAIELFGCADEEQFVTCHPADLSPEYQPDGVKSLEKAGQMMGTAIENGSHFFEWAHQRIDGTEFPATVLLTRMELEGQTVLQATVRDVTSQKQTAEALQAAKEAAEAASRAKSDFLANVSHEIRTPMNAIMGMTELVLDTELAAVQRDYLMSVRESADALLSVINDILDFSRIEAGKLELIPAPFDLHERLGSTMKSLALGAHNKGLELAYQIRPEVPRWLIGDFGRLRQIVVNLVGNAIKFTAAGEVVLEVRRETESNGDVELCFSVNDTGIGIPQDAQATIFDAFEQADASPTREYEGSGLGLAICSRLVHLMGGRIWVESEVGRGSTFSFAARFPVCQDSIPEVPSVSPSQLHNLRILVVDDNRTNRRILEEILRSWSMVPTSVSGARDAFRLLQQAQREGHPYSLLLTDANMPGQDGFSLAQQVKQDADLSETTVIMLTSGGRPGEIARSEQLGIAAYLLKPVKQAELFDAIVASLGLASGTDDAWAAPLSERSLKLPPLRILLVEDSLVNQKLAVGLLKKHDHTVDVANHGKEAVEFSASQDFDLILMDVQMPEMDGFEATRIIREREKREGGHVPIIAMTAHALTGDRQRCLAAGMDEYVAKPIRLEDLLVAIHSLLFGSGRSDDATDPRG